MISLAKVIEAVFGLIGTLIVGMSLTIIIVALAKIICWVAFTWEVGG